MTTPTPRTDDFCNGLRSNCLETTQGAVDLANFARQLEQELNEVRAERDKLKTVLDGFLSYHVFETKTI